MNTKLLLIISVLLSSFSLQSQTWEGDLTKIGQTQSGGFDYQWKNFKSTELGARASSYTFDYTGARVLSHAPAPYVHPRIYFNPEDTTEIKLRLQNTVNGKEVMRKLHAYTTLLHLGYDGTKGGKFSKTASYAVNSQNVCYMNNVGSFDVKWQYDKLVNNDTSGFILKSIGTRFNAMLSMEAIDCFFNKGKINTETGLSYNVHAANLAKAMTVWARVALKSGTLSPTTYTYIGGSFFAVMYDYNYWAMTPVQRDTARMALAKIVPAAPRYGDLNADPYRTVSNWTSLNFFEVIPNFAIEGETGYNPTLTHKWMKVLYRFITYGYFDSGCGWEGIGKNYQMVAQLVASARRGYSLLGHPHVLAYPKYLTRQVQPFGYGFNGEDMWGGSGPDPVYGRYKFNQMDAIGIKYAYPNDTVADFVWRNYAAANVNGVEFPDQAYVLSNNVACTSFDPATNNNLFDMMGALVPYVSDWFTMNWTDECKVAMKNTLDFVDTDRGQMVMRSGFDKNAMSAIFYCRQNTGGHSYPDRNSFSLSANGRIWIPYRWSGSYYDSHAQSLVMVDTIAISNNGGQLIMPQPGKLLNWSTDSKLPQITGDATYAYSWEWSWLLTATTGDSPLLGKADPGKQAWTKVTETLNTFRKTPSSEPFYNTAIYDWLSWNTTSASGTYYDRYVKRPYNPMEKVYRTLSMIRGTHNAVLIVDDVKKDTKTHKYQWTIQLPSDVVLDTKTDNGDGTYDAILKESSGNRRMLVRMLNQNDYVKGSTPTVTTETVPYIAGDAKTYSIYRLSCTSNCIAPDFKVMLYPFIQGETLPITAWNVDKSKLNVIWTDQTASLALNLTNGLTSLAQQTSQTISFPDMQNKLPTSGDFNPSAVASSGLPVSYISDNLAVATILNGKVHIVSAGTANIIATQAGDTNYGMAPQVTKPLIVSVNAGTENPFSQYVSTMPNPVNDILRVSCPVFNNGKLEVKIIDMLGNTQLQQFYSASPINIQVSHLCSGIYTLIISNNLQTIQSKIIKR